MGAVTRCSRPFSALHQPAKHRSIGQRSARMMNKNPQFPRGKRASRSLAARASAMICVIVGLAAVLIQPAAAAEPQVTEGFINAATPEVWRLFTTAEGYQLTGVAHAEVDLKVGGSIRTHYDPKGQLGDAGTIVQEILAYDPERMLATRIRQA